MKNLKLIQKISFSILTFLVLAITSCSKDDEPAPTPVATPIAIVYPEENFLNQYLNTAGLQPRSEITSEFYSYIEYIEFSASQNGKITSVSFKVPATTTLNPVIISIIDVETGLTIKEISTNSSDYTAGTTKTIAVTPPIDIPIFKRYKLGMLSKSSYEKRTINAENIVYPIQAGNIKIWSISQTNISSSINVIKPYNYYGDFSFTFQRI